jgi:hypothetical protein
MSTNQKYWDNLCALQTASMFSYKGKLPFYCKLVTCQAKHIKQLVLGLKILQT